MRFLEGKLILGNKKLKDKRKKTDLVGEENFVPLRLRLRNNDHSQVSLRSIIQKLHC